MSNSNKPEVMMWSNQTC